MKPFMFACAVLLALGLSARADGNAAQKLFATTDVAQRSSLLRQVEQAGDQPQSAMRLAPCGFFWLWSASHRSFTIMVSAHRRPC